MTSFHANWFFVAVISAGITGAWGVVLAAMKRPPGRVFTYAVGGATGVMLIQVVAGAILWQQGQRPGDGFHAFYGVVIAVTFSFAYVYRAQLARRPALGYGLLLLFVMGLGLRAWANVGAP